MRPRVFLGKVVRRVMSAVHRAASALERARYRTPDGHYDAARYWADRHARFGFDIRGVGHHGLSVDENLAMYRDAAEKWVALCRAEGVDFTTARMLDVGCGAGFYAKVFGEQGGRRYLGVDIADTLLGRLSVEHPGFEFRQLDVCSRPLEGTFDLISMIDVTQHITDPKAFSFAMQNIRAHLAATGVFIVTSWLDARARASFYELSRPIETYRAEFPGHVFSAPVPFRDKFIFSIRPPRPTTS